MYSPAELSRQAAAGGSAPGEGGAAEDGASAEGTEVEGEGGEEDDLEKLRVGS